MYGYGGRASPVYGYYRAPPRIITPPMSPRQGPTYPRAPHHGLAAMQSVDVDFRGNPIGGYARVVSVPTAYVQRAPSPMGVQRAPSPMGSFDGAVMAPPSPRGSVHAGSPWAMGHPHPPVAWYPSPRSSFDSASMGPPDGYYPSPHGSFDGASWGYGYEGPAYAPHDHGRQMYADYMALGSPREDYRDPVPHPAYHRSRHEYDQEPRQEQDAPVSKKKAPQAARSAAPPSAQSKESARLPNRRQSSTGFKKGSTMGPVGTVDFASLASSAGSGEWRDPDFTPDDSSLWIDPRQAGGGAIGGILQMQIGWSRVSELSSNAGLFFDDLEDESGEGGAEANDIIQGTLGDCYFLSSLAILCTSKGLGLVEKLFVCQDYFSQGLVGVRFFKEGMWWDVAVDTYLPCNMAHKPPMPVFARNKDPNEFWMSLLEKAYAKIHGSYEALDAGFMNESLVDLTGAAPGSVQILDLFATCMKNGRPDKEKAMTLLENRTFGTLLQGASSDNGGSEEPLGNGLHSGHAYSINQVKRTSTGETLVQLRNPWGGHEWTGAWSDKDPRWTPALKAEMGQTDREDGMFWMDVNDFAKSFTTITYADLVPRSFTVLRAESEWTRKTGGGCPNHKSWKLNPQLLMRVGQQSHITISLNQPDSRMQFRTGELGKEDFDELYGNGTGYETDIGFSVFKGGERKVAYKSKDKVAEAAYSAMRTVSVCIPECAPGEYIIVPATFNPAMMKFRMRFWSNNPIELVDTKGGSEWQVFDASDDALNHQDAPLPMSHEVIRQEYAPPPVPGVPATSQNVIVKQSRNTAATSAAAAGVLAGDVAKVGKATWKVGTLVPENWKLKQDYSMAAGNVFASGEMCAVMRPDRSVRFAKITGVTGATYDLCTGNSKAGLMHKTGVPAQFICKFPMDGPFPCALVDEVGTLFDLLDVDGSGHLDFHFDGGIKGELASDLGKRFLRECQVDPEDLDATYEAMKTLDANGDGVVDREEFIDWMCDRLILLATHVHV